MDCSNRCRHSQEWPQASVWGLSKPTPQKYYGGDSPSGGAKELGSYALRAARIAFVKLSIAGARSRLRCTSAMPVGSGWPSSS